MNIYVISNVWDHSGSTVIGAATDRAGAEQIAERQAGQEEMRGAWAPWVERVDPAEGSCLWERVALHADGTVHPSLSQEIVCVPLAGSTATTHQHELDPWPDKVSFDWQGNPVVQLCLAAVDGQVCRRPYSDPVHLPVPTEELEAPLTDVPWKGWRAVGVTEDPSASLPVALSGPDPDAMRDAMEKVLAARKASELAGGYVDRINVGAGAGLDYFQRAAETLPKPPDAPPWQVHDGDSIAGLRIAVDPDMRPDQIRIGSVIYTIGTGDNGIAEGTMVRVDVAEIGKLTGL